MAVPPAGRAVSTAAAAAAAPLGAGYADEPVPDEGWPGDLSSLPWGLAGSDGDGDGDGADGEDDDLYDNNGKGRGTWEGDPE
jgi:hypothetical protein